MHWSLTVEENAREYPGKEAIFFKGRGITYRRLRERVNALAKGLIDLDAAIREGGPNG